MKNLTIAIILLTTALSCSSNTAEKKEDDVVQRDTAQEDASSKPEQLILHPYHDEDRYYAWFDSRFAGHWVNEAYMKRLIEIFKNDTTISLYDYTSSLDYCNGELLNIDIEGCAKENIFYLKNLGCDNQCIAKSTFDVDTDSMFTLRNVYTGAVYHFETPTFQELTINGKKFVKDHEHPAIEKSLYGTYILYDNGNKLLDTVKYINQRIEGCDFLSGMQVAVASQEHPSLPHADLAFLSFYTGDSTKVELVDDAGDGLGIWETTPEQMHVQFHIKRTLRGFELHNTFDWELEGKSKPEKKFKAGMFYKFRRISAIQD